MKLNELEDRNIIMFDGLCHFCNGSVNFIIHRDPKGYFCFTPMQSDAAQALLKKCGINNTDLDTFLLIQNGICYERTDAALEVVQHLTGFWYLFRVLKILPRAFRDYFYNLFASNRYKLFGKRTTCMVPGKEIRGRFI